MDDKTKPWLPELHALADSDYKAFHAKLIPNIAPERILGVRTPILRGYAREFAKTPEAAVFMKELPHTYYEENNLHAFLIEKIRDYDDAVRALDKFLPYVDNWATCDMMSPPVLGKHPAELEAQIRVWLASPHLYAVRFALNMLMKYFLDGAFREDFLSLAASVPTEEYYLHMMVAWYFATALTKQYDAALPYFEKPTLDIPTHNKAIQKALECRRIPEERKAYLRTLKIR